MENMKLTFVNVGYGEAILLECPDESRPGGLFTLLIDGGSAEAEEYADRSTGRIPLADYLAKRGRNHIDWMLATHLHEDHLCGLLTVAETGTPQVLCQPLPADAYLQMQPLDTARADTPSQQKFLRALADYQALCRKVAAGGGEIRAMQAGETLRPCENLSLRVLGPNAAQMALLAEQCAALYQPQTAEQRKGKLLRLDGEMNNFSLILQVEYCGTRMLLPGDTNALGYGDVAAADLKCDLFKVGHHGQRDSVTEDLFRAIAPAAVVCCASSDRRYNSADAEVLALMRAGGAKLYFSDCPPVPEQINAPHQAVEFSIGKNGALDARYLLP